MPEYITPKISIREVISLIFIIHLFVNSNLEFRRHKSMEKAKIILSELK